MAAENFKIYVGGRYEDKAGRVWVVSRLLPGGKADLKTEVGARFDTSRYVDIRHNLKPVAA